MSFDGETILTFHVLFHVLLLNSLLTSDTLHAMYIKVFGMDSAVNRENMLNWIHFYVIVQIFSLFHHLTSSFILDCEIVNASITDNKREICIFSSYKIHYWKKLLPHKSALIHSETTYIKFFIEMRLKGHPFMLVVVSYLLKILDTFW